MAAGNNTLEETFGLVAAGTEILRQPGRVANGLSTITARLTAQNDEYIASITGGMGVIDKNTGELRSTFDILQDLSKAWENLTSVEKQELTEVVAGKTQRSLFTALMSNFSTAVGATKAALNSEGSAFEENNKRMDSLNGKLTQLQSAWQSFARDTINTDFVKNILSATTGLIKFTDTAGGLVPILLTLGSALSIFKAGSLSKGIFEMSNRLSKFKETVASLGGGLQAFQLALANVKTAEDAAKISTLGFATAAQTLMTALGVIGIVIGVATTAYNLFANSQKEARQATIDSANSHLEEANSLKEKAQKEEENIAKLKEEKSVLENMSTQDDGTTEKIKNKQEEIDKRQENIDKIKEEQRVASEKALGDISGQKGGRTAGGIHAYMKTGVEGEDRKLSGYITEFNERIKEASGNTGKYNAILEQQKEKYSSLLAFQKENGKAYKATEKMLQLLNREQEKNGDIYEEDEKKARIYYEALKNGVSEARAGQEMVDWMQEFYGLNETQMEQLKQGIDVLNEKTQATDNMTEAEKRYAEQMSKLEESESKFEKDLDSSVNGLAKLQEQYTLLNQAQNEYKENGYLTADMYKQLKDADLLQYISDVGGRLEFNTEALEGNKDGLIENAETAIKNAYSQKIMELALADQNGKLEETAKKLGLVTEESNKVSTANVVAQIGKIGLAAIGTNSKLANLFNTLKQKLGIGSGGSGFNADDYTGSEQYKKYKAQLEEEMRGEIDKINKIQLQKPKTSSGSKGKSGTGSSKASSKKTQEEYKAEIDLLYQYENALENAKDEVDRLKDSLGDTENFNEQEKYIKQLINALNNQINKTNELKNAQAGQIRDYTNQLRQQGFSIDYNAEKNELYINNMQHLADFSGDTAKNLEKLIKKIQDLNKDNRSLDSSIRDLRGNVKDYYDQLADIPEKKLKKLNELMKDFQQSQLDQIQNEIDDLNHALENDPRLKALEEQIEALEKQNDTIDKQKEMEEKLLAVEEARQKLANAKKNRTLQVFREGQGFVWETDPDAIKEAEEDLKNAQDALNEQVKNDQLEDLKNQKEQIEKSYQDQIDSLEKFLDEQNYIIDKANREGIQSFDDLRKKLAEFGLDSAENLKKASDWLNNYNQALKDLKNTATNTLSTTTLATNGIIYSSATQDRISQALAGMSFDMTTRTNTQSYDRITQGSNSQTIYINEIQLPNVKDVDDFVEALKDLPRLATTKSSLRK